MNRLEIDISRDLDRKRLADQLRLHEGYRSKVYYDTTGHATVGIGFNLDSISAPVLLKFAGAPSKEEILAGAELTRDQIYSLLAYSIKDAISCASKIIRNYDRLSDVRKRVVIDLAFNLGCHKFSMFKNTIKAIEEERWEDAARGMENSLWYKQVKSRGVRLVQMMKSGDDYVS